MSTLTETEYRTLRMQTLIILGEIGARDNATATTIAAGLVPAVEAIVAAHVSEALDRAAVQIESWEANAERAGSIASDANALTRCRVRVLAYRRAARIVREAIA